MSAASALASSAAALATVAIFFVADRLQTSDAIRRNYPVAIANKMAEPIAGPVQIVGPLCTPLDLLANQ